MTSVCSFFEFCDPCEDFNSLDWPSGEIPPAAYPDENKVSYSEHMVSNIFPSSSDCSKNYDFRTVGFKYDQTIESNGNLN